MLFVAQIASTKTLVSLMRRVMSPVSWIINTQRQSYFLEIPNRIESQFVNLRLEAKMSRSQSSDIALSELTPILVLPMFGVFSDSS